MGMTSMKPEEKGHDEDCQGTCCRGACITLNEEQAEALGLDKHPPAAGSKVGIRAIATVRRVSQEADVNDAEEKGEDCARDAVLELHITDMEVTQNGREPASVLYGGGQG